MPIMFLLYCFTFCYCEMHLPHVNVSRVNTAKDSKPFTKGSKTTAYSPRLILFTLKHKVAQLPYLLLPVSFQVFKLSEVSCSLWKCTSINTTNSGETNTFAPCKRIHEGPGFRIPASGFRISGFRIPYHSGFRIPNHCGFWIPVLWIPDSNSKICWIPDSGFSYMEQNTCM